MNENINIKPLNLKELSLQYGVSSKTFKKWIMPFTTEIGEKRGRFYSVIQVKTIYTKLGVPGNVNESDL